MKKEEIVVSGTRPTGHLHLGNYLGAVKQFVEIQEQYKCYYFIADFHSLTTHPNPEDLSANTKNVIVEYLASGLDPEKVTLYVQSDIPEISELYLLLNMNAYLGELERVTSFKDKVRKQPDNVNAGLLTYPVLMTADIIIHKATKVPVGKDQEQHLEMCRTFARRFNRIYKTDVFPEPVAFNLNRKLIKIPGLDGSGKMGKSGEAGNAIFLVDEPSKIRKKVMRAVTDSGPEKPNQEKSEGVQNLFDIMKYVSSDDTYKYFDDKFNDCSIRYGDLKKQIAENVIEYLTPVRERIKEISANEEYLKKIIKLGAEKARESAVNTIKEVRNTIGIKSI